MAERLELIKVQPAAIIDWWSFGGGGLPLLRKAYPSAKLSIVEGTDALRERSREMARSSWWSLRRRSGIEVLPPDQVKPGDAQLVWANMMVHAAVDPATLFARWQAALGTEGFVMFSCLGPGTLRALRDLYARLDFGPAMAELVDMHDLGDMLLHAGFTDPVMDQETLMLSWQTPDAFLRELRGLGGNASPNRLAGLRTPRWRKRLETELATLAKPDGRIEMPFEVAYGHAFKPAPRATVASETTVSLEAMRAMVRNKPQRG